MSLFYIMPCVPLCPVSSIMPWAATHCHALCYTRAVEFDSALRFLVDHLFFEIHVVLCFYHRTNFLLKVRSKCDETWVADRCLDMHSCPHTIFLCLLFIALPWRYPLLCPLYVPFFKTSLKIWLFVHCLSL